METAYIHRPDGIVYTIYFDYFSSESIEQAYFFMKDKKNVGIVPYGYLILFK